jgi:hypothetical protein
MISLAPPSPFPTRAALTVALPSGQITCCVHPGRPRHVGSNGFPAGASLERATIFYKYISGRQKSAAPKHASRLWNNLYTWKNIHVISSPHPPIIDPRALHWRVQRHWSKESRNVAVQAVGGRASASTAVKRRRRGLVGQTPASCLTDFFNFQCAVDNASPSAPRTAPSTNR